MSWPRDVADYMLLKQRMTEAVWGRDLCSKHDMLNKYFLREHFGVWIFHSLFKLLFWSSIHPSGFVCNWNCKLLKLPLNETGSRILSCDSILLLNHNQLAANWDLSQVNKLSCDVNNYYDLLNSTNMQND